MTVHYKKWTNANLNIEKVERDQRNNLKHDFSYDKQTDAFYMAAMTNVLKTTKAVTLDKSSFFKLCWIYT